MHPCCSCSTDCHVRKLQDVLLLRADGVWKPHLLLPSREALQYERDVLLGTVVKALTQQECGIVDCLQPVEKKKVSVWMFWRALRTGRQSLDLALNSAVIGW